VAISVDGRKLETDVATPYRGGMVAASRHVLPHGARLRGRNDLGPFGLVVAVGVVAFVLIADHAWATNAPPKALRVEETADLDVLLTVDAKDAPTFQVFQVPGRKSFVVELPGLALDPAALEKSGNGVLLDDAHVEPAQKGGPGRVVLAFADEVDYDAGTKGGELRIVFRHAGDKHALIEAHQKRLAELEQKKLAQLEAQKHADEIAAQEKADVEKKQRDEDDKKAAELEAKRVAEEQKRAEIERKRLEDEAKKQADIEAKKKADDERKAEIERKRVEAEAKKQADIEAKKKVDDERKAELERKRAEAEAKRQADIDAKKRAQEERKAEIERKRAEADAKKQAEIEARKKADDERKAEIERKRQADEDARRAADEKKKAEIEQRRLDAEQKKAEDAKRKAEAEEAARVAAEKAKADADAKAVEARRVEDEKRKLDEAKKQAALEEQRKAEEQKRALEEQKKAEEQKRVLDEQKKADDQRRALEDQRRAEEQRRAAEAQQRLDEQKRVLDEQKRAEIDRQRAEADAARKSNESKPPAKRGPGAVAGAIPGATGPVVATVSSAPSKAEYGFGGSSIDLSPTSRYQRYAPPANEDAFGGDDDDNALDESGGRSVLSQVTVQRTQGGSKVGVRVDGGAKYNVARRRNQIVLTLFDTRAANLEVRRILDASSLDATVLRVLPSVEEDSRYRVELTVELREQAPVRVGQEGGMLWLTVGD
jgi:hypothetical protein